MSEIKIKNKDVRQLTSAGLFAAVIFITTAYIHVPTGLGYTHIGDGFIFLAAAMLPKRYSLPAAAVGAAAADAACGMVIWAPATLIIKPLTVLAFSGDGRVICRRNLLALIPALICNVIGYSLYEALFMTPTSLKAALFSAFAQTPFYTVQTLIGALIFTVLGRSAKHLRVTRSGLSSSYNRR